MNLYEIFHQTARRQPEKPAILGPGPEDGISYRDLDAAIEAAGDALRQAGLRPGGCVGVHLPSGTEYIVFTYAVWRCGGCAVPFPTELTAPEKHEICREIALDFVITQRRGASQIEPFRSGESSPLPRVVEGEEVSVMPVSAPQEHPSGFSGVNSAFIRFTSGTTGASKGVLLSHESVFERIHAANDVLHIGPDDRVVWLLSMAYHFAVSIVSYLSFGAAVILPGNRFAPAILAATRRQRGTLMYGSPAHYSWLAECQERAAMPSLRLAISTTTALEASIAERFHHRYELPVVQALGIIEVGLPFINTDFATGRPEAVGRPLPAYRLRMDDVGLGPHLKEVLLAGPGFLDAYYRPWRTRAEIMPDGWFRTGDVGEQNGDGCVFLRGRSKDVISVLGMKFFPQEVEAVLTSHPGVGSACVFARPHIRLGDAPQARVVPRSADNIPTERELLAYCRERLAEFKIPERIEVVAELPRTGSGKVLRRDLDLRARVGGDRREGGAQ